MHDVKVDITELSKVKVERDVAVAKLVVMIAAINDVLAMDASELGEAARAKLSGARDTLAAAKLLFAVAREVR